MKKKARSTYLKSVVDEIKKDARSITNSPSLSIKLDESYKCSDDSLGMYDIEYEYELHLISLGIEMGRAELKSH